MTKEGGCITTEILKFGKGNGLSGHCCMGNTGWVPKARSHKSSRPEGPNLEVEAWGTKSPVAFSISYLV